MSLLSAFDFLEFLFYKIYVKLKRKKSVKFSAWQMIILQKTSEKISITKWCLKSNIHGVQNLIRSKRLILKSIWLLAIISALSICLIIAINYFKIYYSFEIQSKHSIERKTQINFPAFTFCSQENLTNNDVFYVKTCYDSLYTSVFDSSELALQKLADTNYTCYSLNIIQKEREENELAKASFDGNSGICVFSFNTSSEIILYIHRQDTLPNHGEKFTSFLNEYFVIGLRVLNIIMQKKPYSDCVDSWDAIESSISEDLIKNQDSIKYKHNYNQKACIEYCQKNYLNKSSNTKKNLNTSSLFLKCKTACPQKCNEEIYSFSKSLNSFEKNQSSFSIHFDDTNISKLEDVVKISKDDLISSVG